MKQLILVSVLLVISGTVWAADEPADLFLQAYFLIQDGDTAQQQADAAKAATKYAAALEVLNAIKTQSPDWNTHIIEFRLKYCGDQLATLKSQAPVAAAPAPATTSPEPDRTAQLTADLAKARAQVTQLEATRDDLNTKLQEALKQVPATATNPQIEQLLEHNKKMAGQLADAQQQIAELSDRADQLNQAQEQVRQLEADRTRLDEQLKDALAKAATAGNATLQAESHAAELVKKNQELTDQLLAAQKEVATTSPELVTLRAQLAQTTAKLELSEKELAAVRAENITLHSTLVTARDRLAAAEKNLLAVQQSGQKDEQIMLYLRKENAILKELVERKTNITTRRGRDDSSGANELIGWQSRRAARKAPTPPPADQPEQLPLPAMMKSENTELVADLPAPAPLPASNAKAEAPIRTQAPPAFDPSQEKTKALLADARSAIALKDPDVAAGKYASVLELEPNNLIALSNLGVIRYQQGKLDDAETVLRRAVTIAPNDGESRALLGVVCLRKGKIEEAYNELTRAVALNPRHSEAHNYLGITMSEKGLAAGAEQEMRKAIELNPQYADAHFNLAVFYANQKTPRLELARYHYQKALDLGAPHDQPLEKILNAR